MNSDSLEIYQVPTLLSLICFMSAMAFITSAYYWLWRVLKNSKTTKTSFALSIWHGQFLSFLFVMMISIFVGTYDFYVGSHPMNINGELIILGLALAFSYLRARQRNSIFLIWRDILKVILFGSICILGWLVTIIFGWSIGSIIYYSFYISGKSINFDLGFLPILITGLLWNAPIIWIFLKISKNQNLCDKSNNLKIHNFLWPVIAAYLMLLTPLMIQEMANSEKWQEIQNAKPIRRA